MATRHRSTRRRSASALIATGAAVAISVIGGGPGRAAPLPYPPAVSAAHAVDTALSGRPEAAAVGDVTGDGIPDVVVADSAAGAIRVLIGTGRGRLVPGPSVAAVAGVRGLALGDVDIDGRLDVVVVGDSTAALRADGAGGFAPAAPVAGTGPARWIALADLSGDGAPDIVQMPDTGAPAILVGDGAGGFGTPTGGGPAGGFTSPNTGVATGDVNSDGRIDVVGVLGNGEAALLLGDGAGGTTLATVGAGRRPRSFALTDVTADGRLDLVLAEPGTGVITILRGDGTGRFATFGAVTAPGDVASVVMADVNGDGRDDIVQFPAVRRVAVSLATGGGRFGIPLPLPPGGAGTRLGTGGDLDGDGRDDLVLLAPAPGAPAGPSGLVSIVRAIAPGVRATCARIGTGGRSVRCRIWRSRAAAGVPVRLRLRLAPTAPGRPFVVERRVPGGRTSTTLTTARRIPRGPALLTAIATIRGESRIVRRAVALP